MGRWPGGIEVRLLVANAKPENRCSGFRLPGLGYRVWAGSHGLLSVPSSPRRYLYGFGFWALPLKSLGSMGFTKKFGYLLRRSSESLGKQERNS